MAGRQGAGTPLRIEPTLMRKLLVDAPSAPKLIRCLRVQHVCLGRAYIAYVCILAARRQGGSSGLRAAVLDIVIGKGVRG